MKKVYYLSSCSTCKRIINNLSLDDFEKQDIKFDKITEKQLKEMRSLTDSYESLFSRRSQKFKALGLASQNLEEEDYKKYILEEYTFLKRPVFVIDDEIFIGNSKKVIEKLSQKLNT